MDTSEQITVTDADVALAAKVLDKLRPSLQERLLTAFEADAAENGDFSENGFVLMLWIGLLDSKLEDLKARRRLS